MCHLLHRFVKTLYRLICRDVLVTNDRNGRLGLGSDALIHGMVFVEVSVEHSALMGCVGGHRSTTIHSVSME